jgi:GGDEF domain-containing protein
MLNNNELVTTVDALYYNGIATGAVRAGVELYNISDRKRTTSLDLENAADALRYELNHDVLTGLKNRRAFKESMNRQDSIYLALDIDGLKPVNDSLGHDIGDQLIIASAHALRSVVSAMPDGDAARMGGDEFLGVFSGGIDFVDPSQIQAKLSRAFQLSKENSGVSSGIGSFRCGIAETPAKADLIESELKTLTFRLMGFENINVPRVATRRSLEEFKDRYGISVSRGTGACSVHMGGKLLGSSLIEKPTVRDDY